MCVAASKYLCVTVVCVCLLAGASERNLQCMQQLSCSLLRHCCSLASEGERGRQFKRSCCRVELVCVCVRRKAESCVCAA